jgi:DUF1680 family protein
VRVLERDICNNALSGVSLSGDRFFDVNRLASAGDGRDERWERASLHKAPQLHDDTKSSRTIS